MGPNETQSQQSAPQYNQQQYAQPGMQPLNQSQVKMVPQPQV